MSSLNVGGAQFHNRFVMGLVVRVLGFLKAAETDVLLRHLCRAVLGVKVVMVSKNFGERSNSSE